MKKITFGKCKATGCVVAVFKDDKAEYLIYPVLEHKTEGTEAIVIMMELHMYDLGQFCVALNMEGFDMHVDVDVDVRNLYRKYVNMRRVKK